jgi:hypothetical protein
MQEEIPLQGCTALSIVPRKVHGNRAIEWIVFQGSDGGATTPDQSTRSSGHFDGDIRTLTVMKQQDFPCGHNWGDQTPIEETQRGD